MRIGIIREGKAPPDKRVPFTPEQCRYINQHMSGLEVVVQPSEIRCFSDEEYRNKGITVQEDLSDCDVLMGVKEVPISDLLPGKIYFFFSHTIKKQPYNRKLLQEIVKRGIQLVDYEVLTDRNGMRIIGFGRFAGLVGTYNGFRAYGLRNGLFDLKPAWLCHDMDEMVQHLQKVNLPDIRIAVTGGGRVAGGVLELLDELNIRKLNVEEYLSGSKFSGPVYVQLNPGDYNQHKLGLPFDLLHFYNHPADYIGTFGQYLPITDMLIGAAYWDPKAPVLFTLNNTRTDNFRISVIADITCDIDGSIPTTRRASTIDNPFYDFDPESGDIREPFSSKKHITVMAVDNLPCELPKDASHDFGKNLTEKVLPHLIGKDPDHIIERASITKNGKLNDRFEYLKDYVEEAG
jgi:saccharopine dehydrogenase (NAD+, L-lysine forming)